MERRYVRDTLLRPMWARQCRQCPLLRPVPSCTARFVAFTNYAHSTPPAPTILQSILPYLIGVLGLSLIVAGILLLNGGSNPEPPPPSTLPPPPRAPPPPSSPPGRLAPHPHHAPRQPPPSSPHPRPAPQLHLAPQARPFPQIRLSPQTRLRQLPPSAPMGLTAPSPPPRRVILIASVVH